MKKVYCFKCDFCSKLYQRKGYCLRHEIYCYKNPNNHHICLKGCEYLKASKNEKGHKDFYCSIKKQHLFSYVAEKKGLEFPDDFERMPLDCDQYKLNEDVSTTYW